MRYRRLFENRRIRESEPVYPSNEKTQPPQVSATDHSFTWYRGLWLLVLLNAVACTTQGSDMNPQEFASPQAAALYQAAAKRDRDGANRLIAAGANPNSRNEQGFNLLEVAMRNNDRSAFETLLAAGADPTDRGDSNDTAMHVAAILEDPFWLRTLLDRGVSTEVRNARGETPLFSALGNNPHADQQVRALLDAGADIHARDDAGATLLHKAARINAFDWVVRFLEAGVDPRATDRLGVTFQPAFFRTRESNLLASAKTSRERVRGWLRQNQIAIEEKER